MKWRGREKAVFRIEPHEVEALELTGQRPVSVLATRFLWGMNLAFGLYEISEFLPASSVSQVGFYLVRLKAKNAPLLWISVYLRSPLSLVLNQLKNGYFERRLAFDAEGNWCRSPTRFAGLVPLVVEHDACFWGKSGWGQDRAPFSIGKAPFQNLRDSISWRSYAPDEKLASLFQRELENPDSDCAFSWRWLGLDEKQRRRLLFQTRRGTFDDYLVFLQNLAHANWPSDATKIQLETKIFKDYPQSGEQERVLVGFLRDRLAFWNIENNSQLDFLPDALALFERALRFYAPSLRPEFQLKSAVRSIYEYDAAPLTLCGFDLPAPSFHDQIEAQIFLTEWEKTHFAP